MKTFSSTHQLTTAIVSTYSSSHAHQTDQDKIKISPVA